MLGSCNAWKDGGGETWLESKKDQKKPNLWTIVHAFYIIMGGFYFYRKGEPIQNISFREVLKLVEKQLLAPPTLIEIQDKSKTDALSKTIAVVQTLWFVVQCITRSIRGLAMSELEVMTLAYTVITFAMYAVWWYKPCSVGCPTRVICASPHDSGISQTKSITS
ncbi:hypothetical protein HWV62_40579 [Athelia sp. TMB]|nr:hypothetical protein HWV62_40579 [Athelia sp. TMB]